MTVLETAPPPVFVRSRELDALRGLAILCMVVDHVAVWVGPEVFSVRATVGRVAMPLFFLLGGHLARGASRRLLVVFGVGLVLGVLAPWSGAAPLLAWFCFGAVLVGWAGPRASWLLVLVGLGMLANPSLTDLTLGVPGSYPVPALLALMALGRTVDRSQLVRLGAYVARFRLLVWAGRWPLTIYAGHVLVLTASAPAWT